MKPSLIPCIDSGHSCARWQRARPACGSRTQRRRRRTNSPSSGSTLMISRRAICFMGPAAPTRSLRRERATHGCRPIRRVTVPGFEVRGPDGRTWDVKLGPEAQSEVVASRVLWAIGYHQPATYYVSNWQLAGGPGGQQQGARFRLESDDTEVDRRLVVGRQRVPRHAAVSRADRREHSAEQLGLEDVEQQDLSRQERRVSAAALRRARSRRVARKDQPSRLLWILPIPVRGFGQGSRNDIDDFESQGFIKRVDEDRVEFDFRHHLRIGRRSRAPVERAMGCGIAQPRVRRAMGRCVQGGRLQPRCPGAIHQEDQGEDC